MKLTFTASRGSTFFIYCHLQRISLVSGRIRMEPCYAFVCLFLRFVTYRRTGRLPTVIRICLEACLRPLRYLAASKMEAPPGIRMRKSAPDLFLFVLDIQPQSIVLLCHSERYDAQVRNFRGADSLCQISRRRCLPGPNKPLH